jgi:Mce-associated membrane protein
LASADTVSDKRAVAPPADVDETTEAGATTEIHEPDPSTEAILVAEGGGSVSAADSRSRVRRWAGSLRGRRLNPLVAVCLAVALIVAGILLTVSRMSLSDNDALNSARTSALAASRSYSVELASYDYHHLDQDFGKVLADSTPAFKQTFSQSSSALKTILARYNATATANVIAAGLVSASINRAVALVFLNQTVSNTTQKKGQPATTQSRVEITLLHEHGRWLIDQVSLL